MDWAHQIYVIWVAAEISGLSIVTPNEGMNSRTDKTIQYFDHITHNAEG